MWCKNDFYACLLLSSHSRAVETEDGQSPEKGLNKLLDGHRAQGIADCRAGTVDGDKALWESVSPRAWFQRWSGVFLGLPEDTRWNSLLGAFS